MIEWFEWPAFIIVGIEEREFNDLLTKNNN